MICIDVETTSKTFWRAKLVCATLYHCEEDRYEFFYTWGLPKQERALREACQQAFSSREELLFFNGKYDIEVLFYAYPELQIFLSTMNIQDANILAAVLKVNRQLSLEKLVEEKLGMAGFKGTEIKKYIDHMQDCPRDLAEKYNKRDTEYSYKLWLKLLEDYVRMMVKCPTIDFIYETEIECLKELIRMEMKGINIDLVRLGKLKVYFQTKMQSAEVEIRKHYQGSLNMCDEQKEFINNLAELELAPSYIKKLKEWEQSDKSKPEPKKKYLCSKMTRAEIDHPLIKPLEEYQRCNKMLTTYIGNIISNTDDNGFLHCSFRQTLSELGGTKTGRLSCANPNLQNIPARSEELSELRKCFVSSSQDYAVVSIDFSGEELTITANDVDDEGFKELVATKKFHDRTAEVAGIPRSDAKTINFAKLYGGGCTRVAGAMKINSDCINCKKRTDAIWADKSVGYNIKKVAVEKVKGQCEGGRISAIMDKEYGFLKEKIVELKEDTKKNGYSTTLFGRPIYPEEYTQYLSHRIQGTGGDIIKIVMGRRVGPYLRESGAGRILINVHDELVLELRKDCLGEELDKIINMMEDWNFTPKLSVEVSICEGHWPLK